MLVDEPNVALVAVGGYGLGRLAPHSDLDVVLLHRGRRDVDDLARSIWYPIWDAGVELDHSVRTPDEVLALAATDLPVMLGLLEGRHIAGDPSLSGRVLERAREHWIRHSKRWVPALAGVARKRHERYGEVAHLLEPDLKDGKGGLRDLDAVHAIVTALPELASVSPDLDGPQDCLVSARAELHRASGRRLDCLLLQHQDTVAENLGFADADELMRSISASGRAISWQLDDVVRRAGARIAGPRRRSAGGGDRPIARSIVLRDGELDLVSDARLDDASLAFRLAAAAVYLGVPIAHAALARLRDELVAPIDPWPDDVREALVSLLGGGRAMVPVFETLDHYGLITRALPEWEAVRSKPQRNAFHRYTVDRHLLEAVAEATRLTRDVDRPDLLLVGALLHDIGKGYSGDHTDAGVEVATRLLARMGFPPEDAAVVVTLVREHLLLARVATSRDLTDPRTLEAVASAVGSNDTLGLLAALTEADSIATGSAAWSTWKQTLLRDLVTRVRRVLAGQAPSRADAGATERARQLLERVGTVSDGAVVELRGERLGVVTEDRPGLLALLVGLLTVHGQSIRSAHVWTSDRGIAVDEFEIEPVFDRAVDPEGLAADIDLARAGRLPLEAKIDERARLYRPRASAARPAEPRVLIHDDASEESTVLEVRAADAVGLLYRLTRTVSRLGLDIHQAKVVTLGHEAVDTFYLRDANGQKLTMDAASDARDALQAELASP